MTFAMSWAALTVLSLIIGFVVHGVVLGPEYMKLAALFRPEQEAHGYFGWILIHHVCIGAGMTWIYRQGRESKPFLAQGVRFGLAVSLVAVVPMYLIYYAVQPMPGMLVAKQIVFDTIGTVILGIVAAWINQRDTPVSAASAA